MRGRPRRTAAASSRSGVEVSHQRTSAYGAYASARAIGASIPGREAEEALGRALAGRELAVALVDVAGEKRRGEGVGARDEDASERRARPRRAGRRPASGRTGSSGRAPCRRGGRTSSPTRAGPRSGRPAAPASMNAFMSSNALSGPPKPASASATIGASQYVPFFALGRVDLVGAEQRTVDALHERRRAVRRVEALIRIRVSGEVGVRSDLPAGEVDRLQAGLDHLHGLRAGHRAERGDVVLRVRGAPRAALPRAAPACARCGIGHGSARRRRGRRAARFPSSGRSSPQRPSRYLPAGLCATLVAIGS